MATIDELFNKGTDINQDPVPLQPSEARQPDTVAGIGELRESLDPSAQFRQQDKELALVVTELPTADEVEELPVSIFPVRVTASAGAQGTATTRATFTYDVSDLEGNQLGTSIPVQHPRPFGIMEQPASNSFGLAFRDEADDLRLWSVGEVPEAGACPL